MSKPVFTDILSLSGRRNRKSFILLVLACTAIYAVIIGVLTVLASLSGAVYFSLLLILPAYFCFAVVIWVAAAQRCRDLGWPGWAVIPLILVGSANSILTNIYGESLASLLFAIAGFLMVIGIAVLPGEHGPNRYGSDPLAGEDEPQQAN